MTLPSDSAPVVLVLASGAGRRFRASGGAGSKLQAPLHGRAVLEWTLAAVRESGLPWHLEDKGHPGMGDAVATAVRATADAPGWMVLPGDLPLIAPSTLQIVADTLHKGSDAVVVPHVGAVQAHPVGFAAEAGPLLATLSGPEGARSVVQTFAAAGRVRRLALQDEGAVTDIDTMADLQRAEALLAARRSVSGG